MFYLKVNIRNDIQQLIINKKKYIKLIIMSNIQDFLEGNLSDDESVIMSDDETGEEEASQAIYKKICSIRMKKRKTINGSSQGRDFQKLEDFIYYIKKIGVGYEEGKNKCIPHADYDNKYDDEKEQTSEWLDKINEIYDAWASAYDFLLKRI